MDWDQAIEDHGAALLLYARQWAGSLADAEDAVQEGFLRIWRKRSGDDGDLVPLLFTAVKRSALDGVRRRERRLRREQRAAGEDFDAPKVTWFECSLEEAERRQEIETALRKLPIEQREVLVLKIWGEMTFRQVAQTLGIPANTAASRYRYALGALRELLTEGGECHA